MQKMKKANRVFFFILSFALLMSGASAVAEDLTEQAQSSAESGDIGATEDRQNETSPPEPSKEERIGALQVESDPSGARVSVTNDESYPPEEIGDTPLLEDSAPGAYWVNVVMDGYEEIRVKVNVHPGEKTIVRIDLKPEKNSYQVKRIVGHSLLWPGLAVVATGIVLIEVEPQGAIGASGFVTAGVGVALTIAGGILLGLSHRDKVFYEQPQLAIAPLSDWSGGGILFSRSF
jgi:hypothetical protein